MIQIILNDHQACWLLQLALYDFTIHYQKDSLNPADRSTRWPDYLAAWEVVEDISVGKLMSSLSNKLATAVLEVNKQFYCTSLDIDSGAQELIRVLSLQVTTCSAARSAADDLDSLVLELSDIKLNPR